MHISLRVEKKAFYYEDDSFAHCRKLNNCSLGSNIRVSSHAKVCQVDRFSPDINFKGAHSCNYEIPD